MFINISQIINIININIIMFVFKKKESSIKVLVSRLLIWFLETHIKAYEFLFKLDV